MRWRWPTTPGCRSTRWTAPRACTRRGESATDADNVTLLLAELESATDADNVTLLLVPSSTGAGRPRRSKRIAPVSGDGGFGYDPVFVPTEGDGRTFAAMTGAEKQAISHRGRALRDLVRRLAD